MKSCQALMIHGPEKMFDTNIIEENFDVILPFFTLPKAFALKHHIASILEGFQMASSDELTELFQVASLIHQVPVSSSTLKAANKKGVELGLAKIASLSNKKEDKVTLSAISQVTGACTETVDVFDVEDMTDLIELAGAVTIEDPNCGRKAQQLESLNKKASDSDYQGVLKSLLFTKEWQKLRKAVASDIEQSEKLLGPVPLLKVVANHLTLCADFTKPMTPEGARTCKDAWKQALLLLKETDDGVMGNQALKAMLDTDVNSIGKAMTFESQALQRFAE